MIVDRLLSARLLIPIAAFSILVSVLCLARYPAIGGDDVVLASTALNVVTHGSLARPINHGAGFPVIDCYPPVVPILMAASYRAFGFGPIQTKLPGFMLGIATAALLFLMSVRIGGWTTALIATVVFIGDPVTFGLWQSGREDIGFVFAMAASICIGYLSVRASNRLLPVIWFATGLLTGVAYAAYYPFALVAVVISALGLWSLVWCDAQFNLRERVIRSLCLVTGLAVVLVVLLTWLSSHLALCRAQIFAMSPAYFDLHARFGNHLSTVAAEWQRYWNYSLHQMGLPSLMLGIASLAMIPFSTRNRWELAVPWFGTISSIAFLMPFAQKDSRYLGTTVLLGCLVLAVVYREIETGASLDWTRSIVKSLVMLILLADVLRLSLVAFTVVHQWQGRDFDAFDARVRAAVPDNVRVVGPQTVFFALGNSGNDLWLYTQGDARYEQLTGETAMNDPGALADVSYVIIDERQMTDRLTGLRNYVRSNFRLVAKVSPPFRSLPWAKTPPLDVKIFARNGNGHASK